MKNSLSKVFMSFGAFMLIALDLSAQQPQFRSGVKTVPVYATVTDRAGRFVTDLTQDKFEILDEGKKVELTQFSNQFVPITAAIMLDLSRSMLARYDAVIANLFMHHFEADALSRLFRGIARISECFIACEPRRAQVALARGPRGAGS